MSTAELNPRPIRVSPLIKFGRWSLLSLGILYGLYHQRRLSRKEAAIRAGNAKSKAIREAQLAEEKQRMLAAEAQMFEEWSKK